MAKLGHGIKALLWCDDDSPLASVLLLKQLDKHVRGIIREPFGSDSRYDVILAKVFEILSGVLSALNPERIVLGWLAIIWDLAIE